MVCLELLQQFWGPLDLTTPLGKVQSILCLKSRELSQPSLSRPYLTTVFAAATITERPLTKHVQRRFIGGGLVQFESWMVRMEGVMDNSGLSESHHSTREGLAASGFFSESS